MFDLLQQVLIQLTSKFDVYALLIGIVFAFIIYLFFGAHKIGKLDWTDLITSKGTNKVSLTKFLQLIGGITSTWIMVYMTLHSSLSTEIFLTYLVYVGAIDGWSKFVAAKYGFAATTDSPTVNNNVPVVNQSTNENVIISPGNVPPFQQG